VKERRRCDFSREKEKREKKESGERRRSSVVCIGTFHRSRKMEVAVELKTYILILKLI
jgi:hypothetical protein